MTHSVVARLLAHIGLGASSDRAVHTRKLEAEVHAARSRFFEVGQAVQRQSSALTLTNMKTAGYANSVSHAVQGVADALGKRRMLEGENEHLGT